MARECKAQSTWIGVKCMGLGVLAWGLTHTARSEQFGEPIPASVRVCRTQLDALERLRCYDAAVDSSAQASTVPVVPPAATPADRRPDPPQGAVAARAASPAAPARATETTIRLPMFTAKVSALDFRPSGAVNLTLDNGQVWAQYGPEGRVPLHAGDSVTVRPGLFGASVLVGPSGWLTKVHLLR